MQKVPHEIDVVHTVCYCIGSSVKHPLCHDFTDNELQGLSIAETERKKKRKSKVYQSKVKIPLPLHAHCRNRCIVTLTLK